MNETRIAELLDALTPTYEDRKDEWERVAAAAGAPGSRTHRAWWVARLAAAAVTLAAVATLVLA